MRKVDESRSADSYLADILSDMQALDSLEALRLLLKQSVNRGKSFTFHLRHDVL